MREEEVATEISLGRLKKMYYVSETCEITKVSKTYSSLVGMNPLISSAAIVQVYFSPQQYLLLAN
jgi:hypothetical protein